MKRKLAAAVAALAMLASILSGLPARAHPVTVDTSRGEWFGSGTPSSNVNIGQIARNTAQQGEYVWRDEKGDQRIASSIGATGTITPAADLVKFHVTADATNLYFLARVDRYGNASITPTLELMISIDTDHASGETALPGDVNTLVATDAAWEYVVQTNFGSGAAGLDDPPLLYSPAQGPCTGCTAQLVTANTPKGSYVELKVPWSLIGGKPDPQDFRRFTVSTYYSDHRVPPDANLSAAIDVLSQAPTTQDELANVTIDTFVDLHFDANGEVFAPLLISEFMPNPPGGDPEGEWIEIYNPNAFDVSLSNYKIGDEPYRGGDQGLRILPSQLLADGQALVIANNRTLFLSRYPGVPPENVIEMTSLSRYTDYASGDINLQNSNNGNRFKESVALLDPQDTIVDLVQYTTPVPASRLNADNRPIVLGSTIVPTDASFDRCPSSRDTNDSSLDFVMHTALADQTPGEPCAGVPGIDLQIAKFGPTSASPGNIIQYVISFNNAGDTAASSIVVSDTLPTGLTCTSQQASPGVTFTSGNCPGGTALRWTLGTLGAQSSGTITLTATIAANAPPNTPLVNRAAISSNPAEDPATLGNNSASQTVTLFKPGVPDLSVSSTWPTTARPLPGARFLYTITYANNGGDDATNVVISDTLPSGLTLIEESSTDANFNGATSGTLVWTVPSLEPGESGAITLLVQVAGTVPMESRLTNVIRISGAFTDPTPANNIETKSLTVGRQFLRYLPIIMRA